jgi:hypothetical protein
MTATLASTVREDGQGVRADGSGGLVMAERWPARGRRAVSRVALACPAQGAYNSFGTLEPPPTAKALST